MVQIIAGRKGKGKTKHLLDMANNGIKAATGSIVISTRVPNICMNSTTGFA